MRRIAILLSLLFTTVAAFAQPMSLALDATDVARGVLHAHETIPATAGAMTLLYPKWTPGEHGPTGPLAGLVNVQITANGQRLAWRRDPVEMFAFHFDVPQGASSIDVTLDSLLPSGGQFSGGVPRGHQLEPGRSLPAGPQRGRHHGRSVAAHPRRLQVRHAAAARSRL